MTQNIYHRIASYMIWKRVGVVLIYMFLGAIAVTAVNLLLWVLGVGGQWRLF